MIVDYLQYHIDNGGITIEVHQTDDELRNVSIKLNTSYFGYPDITSVLNLNGSLGSNQRDFLRSLGAMFIEAAGKIGN